MRLVADENCDFSLVTDLRAAGYDVVAISEQMAGPDDQRVIDLKAILEKYSGRSKTNSLGVSTSDASHRTFMKLKKSCNLLIDMVVVTGFEPATPTSRR